jgi:hypothetical protein
MTVQHLITYLFDSIYLERIVIMIRPLGLLALKGFSIMCYSNRLTIRVPDESNSRIGVFNLCQHFEISYSRPHHIQGMPTNMLVQVFI